jgi:hypothetical protein
MNESAPKSEGLLLAHGRARQIEISQLAPLRAQHLGEQVQAARLVHAIPVLGAPAKRHAHQEQLLQLARPGQPGCERFDAPRVVLIAPTIEASSTPQIGFKSST